MKVPSVLINSLLSIVVCSTLLSGETISKFVSAEQAESIVDSAKKSVEKHTTHWGYTGHGGPGEWGDLSPENIMCKKGTSQSPINIEKSVSVTTKGLDKIGFNYKASTTSVLNNGHTIQVAFENGSSIKLDGIEFNLKQVHFHTPSENQIGSKSFPLEAHFVHASKDGALAVLALMFEDGKENPFIKKVWESMPIEADKTTPLVLLAKDIDALLPKDRSYYRFNGSLTTPPCSEGVRWLVLKNYSKISAKQVEEFLHVMHHENSRPIQPINARKVMN